MRVTAAIGLVGLVLSAAACGGSKHAAPPGPSCADVSKPAARGSAHLKAPAAALDSTKRWRLTFETTCGMFVVQLQPKTSPHATASLVALARRGFFDGTIFHRIVPGFVIQGGDPTQSGGGGPGYSTVDTPKAGTRYDKGTVAMAKTAIEARGAAGSQFFVMTAAAPTLPPDYAVVGRVVSGAAVVQLIGTFGDASNSLGTPTRTVVIRHVTVTEE
jgi:cyclophilin family peptidyl-prolyl cis-trans isomerase